MDIDKVERYPVTFVVKSDDAVENLLKNVKENAEERYPIKSIVEKYMDCIEEVINIPKLVEYLDLSIKKGSLNRVIKEIILQSKVEFNVVEDEGEDEE